MASTSVRSGNRLLDCLIQKEGSLEEDVEITHFEAGHQFYAPGASISAVFFPMGSVVSLMVSLADGQKVEVATVGREGMVGVDALLRTKHSRVLAVQQVEGDVAHISADSGDAGPPFRLMSGQHSDPCRPG